MVERSTSCKLIPVITPRTFRGSEGLPRIMGVSCHPLSEVSGALHSTCFSLDSPMVVTVVGMGSGENSVKHAVCQGSDL